MRLPSTGSSLHSELHGEPTNDVLFQRLCSAVDWKKAESTFTGNQPPQTNEHTAAHSEAFVRTTSQVGIARKPFRRRNSEEAIGPLPGPAKVEENAVQKSTCKNCSRAWLFPELPWGAPPSWRQHKMRGKYFLTVWDVVMFIGCLYVAGTVPFVIAFERPEGCIFTAKGSEGLWVFASFEILMDIVFLVDIIITFHTARWFISSDGTPHWELVDDLSSIRTMYMKGAFTADLLGQIPWQYMDCIAPHVGQELKLLRLFRLFKLLRLRRLRRLLQVANTRYPHSELVIAAWQLVLTMVIGAHWMACIWYMTGKPDGWVLDEGLVDEHGYLMDGVASYAWVTSFYWAVTTMSTIGYGDISAVTERERLVASFVMFMGCGLFAWTTSKLTSVLTKTSICEAQFNTKMEELNEYMAARALPQSLVMKTQSFYMLKFPTRRIWNEEAILHDLPVELRKEIFLELFRDVVAMSPLFSACSVEVQREVCYRMRPVYKEARRRVMTEGEVPGALYIVRHGQVTIEAKGEKLMVAVRGTLFGENALLGLTQEFKRSRSAVTETLCELCMLEASDLHELLVENEEFHQVIARMTKRFTHWLETGMSEGRALTQADLLCVDWHQMSKHVEAEVAQQKRRESTLSVQDIRELALIQPGRASSGGGGGGHKKSKDQGGGGEGSSRRRRQQLAGKGGKAAVAQLDIASLRPKPIRTLLKLSLRGLHGVPQRLRSYSPLVTVQWGGALGHAAGEQLAETSMFSLLKGEGGEVPVEKTVTLALLHQNNNWEEMPPLVVAVWRLRSDQHETLAREGTFRGDRSFGTLRAGSARGLFGLLDSRKGSSGAGYAMPEGFEDCVKIWEGEVSLARVVTGRVHREGLGERLEVPLHPMDSEVSQGQVVVLQAECQVNRVLWKSSRWLSLLPLFRAKGHLLGSRYFQEHRRRSVEQIAAAVWSFDLSVQRERRHRQAVTFSERLLAFDGGADRGRGGAGEAREQQRGGTPVASVSPGGRKLSSDEEYDGVSVHGRQPSMQLHDRRRKIVRRLSEQNLEASLEALVTPPLGAMHGGRWPEERSGAGVGGRRGRKRMSPLGGSSNSLVEGEELEHHRTLKGVEHVEAKGNGDGSGGGGGEEGGRERERVGEREEGKGAGREVAVGMEAAMAAIERVCEKATQRATATAVREVKAGLRALMDDIRGGLNVGGVRAEGEAPAGDAEGGEEGAESGRLMSATKVLRQGSEERTARQLSPNGGGHSLGAGMVGGRAAEMRRRCDGEGEWPGEVVGGQVALGVTATRTSTAFYSHDGNEDAGGDRVDHEAEPVRVHVGRGEDSRETGARGAGADGLVSMGGGDRTEEPTAEEHVRRDGRMGERQGRESVGSDADVEISGVGELAGVQHTC